MDRRKFMQSTLGTIGGLLGLGCVPKAEAKPIVSGDRSDISWISWPHRKFDTKRFSHWLLAITGDAKSQQWCKDHGLEWKSKSEWDGGYFVRDVEEIKIVSIEPHDEVGPLIATLNYHYDGEAPGVDWVTVENLE